MASRKLEVEITGDSRSLERAFGRAGKSGNSLGKSLAGLGRTAAIGIGAAVVAGGFLGKKMIGLASDAAEVESKFKVIFGKEMPGMIKNLDDFSRATGASRFELREQVADMGALLEPLSANKKAAGELSVEMTKLATDLGSFNNVPTADALLAIRSGLVGEAEPLRRFGVLLNAAAVEQEGLRLGLVKGKEAMTEQQKVQARASLIMQQTTLAQGDAIRTSDSFANQIKRLKNGLTDMGTSIGTMLLPHILKFVQFINEHMPQIEAVVEGAIQGIVKAFEGIGAGVDIAITLFEKIKSKAEAIWPQVASIIGISLGDIDEDLRVTRQGLGDFQAAHQSFWDKIRAREQQARAWHEGEFAPALKNVLKGLQTAWDTFGDTIIKITQTLAIKIATPIKELMNILGVQIRSGLAALRGDWGKAWDQLRDAVVSKVGAILGDTRLFVSNLLQVFGGLPGQMVALGAAVLEGFLRGLTAKFEAVKSFISGIASWIADHKGPEAKDKQLLYAAGLYIIEGLQNGMKMQWEKLKQLVEDMSPELASRMGKVVDAAIAAITAKQGALASAFDALLSQALSAFDRISSEFQTKTEKKIAAQDERRAAKERADALAEAQRGLAAAQAQADAVGPQIRGQAKPEGFDEANAALLAAQKQVADAEFAIQRAKDEKAAAQERQDYEQKRERQRFHLDQRLQALRQSFLDGEITVQQFNTRLTKLLEKGGIPLRNAAERLGFALAAGLRAAISEARQAAKELAAAIVEQIGGIAVSVKIHVSQSSSEGQKRARGGPVTAGQGYIVGEDGPEFFVPGKSGTIIPNGSGGGMAMAGGGATYINVNVPQGFVGSEEALANAVGKAVATFKRNNGSAPF